MSRIRITYLLAGGLLFSGAAVMAQRPERDISPARHENLAAAQRLCREAWDKIVEAQRFNEWDLKGHAQRAKELLDQASAELKLAAEASNRR